MIVRVNDHAQPIEAENGRHNGLLAKPKRFGKPMTPPKTRGGWSALGMLLSSLIKQLENFAGVMNFVIFPMFFASSALYPLWRVREGSPWLATACELNPFTHAVELIRFAFYGQINWLSLGVVAGCTVVFLGGGGDRL